MTHITCRLTAKNRDQLRNPTLGNRLWATFTFTKTNRVRYYPSVSHSESTRPTCHACLSQQQYTTDACTTRVYLDSARTHQTAIQCHDIASRRLRGTGDMIEVFKMTHNIYDPDVSLKLEYNLGCSTRGKLLNCTFCHNLRKYYFSACITNIWNSLPNCVVDVSTINQFKARLDKFWSHQDILYDYTADLTGIGDRSVHVTKDE